MRYADCLSKSLQTNTISAARRQKVAGLTLKNTREYHNYQVIFVLETGVTKSAKLDVLDTELPTKRKAPRGFEVGTDETQFPATVEEHYHRYYFEVLDLVINCIEQ